MRMVDREPVYATRRLSLLRDALDIELAERPLGSRFMDGNTTAAAAAADTIANSDENSPRSNLPIFFNWSNST